MEKTAWSVSANKDQLVKHGLMSPEWIPSVKVPNRVVREFAHFDHAKDTYVGLKGMGLVAFKNWL